MKALRSKIVILIIAATTFLYFTNDYGLVDIEKTAIIVAIGIDYEEEKEEYSVTAQIAVPESSENAVDNEQCSIEGKGKTVADAIDSVGVNTGWYPLLSFCHIVLLGNGAITGDVADTLSFIIRSDRIPDSALVVACEKKAKDVLNTKTPLDNVSSFALEKVLVKDIAKSDRIASSSVKDFIKNYYSMCETSQMPLLKIIEIDDGSSKEGEQSGGGSGGGGEKKKKASIFDATSTLFFKKGEAKMTLDSEETQVYNLIYKNALDSYILIDDAEVDGEKTAAVLDINEITKDMRFDFSDEKSPKFILKMNVRLGFEDLKKTQPVKDLTPRQTIPDEILETTRKKMEKLIISAFEKGRENDCDILHLKEKLYKFNFDKFGAYGEDILKTVELIAEINCSSEVSN